MKLEIDVDDMVLKATQKSLADLVPEVEWTPSDVAKLIWRAGAAGISAFGLMGKEQAAQAVRVSLDDDRWAKIESAIITGSVETSGHADYSNVRVHLGKSKYGAA